MDYPDNAERFIFFSKAVVHLARYLPWRPELVHLHDWQTGLAAVFMRTNRCATAGPRAPPTCLTIHNLAYQGNFPAAKFALTNLPDIYFQPGRRGVLRLVELPQGRHIVRQCFDHRQPALRAGNHH